MKVFSKYQMSLNAIKTALCYSKEENKKDWKNQYQGFSKNDLEQNGLWCLDNWCCDVKDQIKVKELIEKIETLIKEYENGNQE